MASPGDDQYREFLADEIIRVAGNLMNSRLIAIIDYSRSIFTDKSLISHPVRV